MKTLGLIFIFCGGIGLFSADARSATWTETTQADFADGQFNVNLYAAKDSIAGVVGDGALRMTGGCMDIDGNGWADVVISNGASDTLTYDPPLFHDLYSYVYWGPGFDTSYGARCSLLTHEAVGNCIVDIDNDGLLDIVFSNGSSESDTIHTRKATAATMDATMRRRSSRHFRAMPSRQTIKGGKYQMAPAPKLTVTAASADNGWFANSGPMTARCSASGNL